MTQKLFGLSYMALIWVVTLPLIESRLVTHAIYNTVVKKKRKM